MLKLFTIRDIKGNSFSPPAAHPTVGLAERWLKELATDPNTQIAKYPEDFSLLQIGEFDPNTATMTSQHPVLIMEAIAAKNT